MPTVIITITPTGEATVDAQGYTGSGCSETKAIEKALGSTTSDTKKPEYTQMPTKASEKVRQR